MDQFVALRSRYAMKLFKKLDESKATGPDRIPATILKRLAEIPRSSFHAGVQETTAGSLLAISVEAAPHLSSVQKGFSVPSRQLPWCPPYGRTFKDRGEADRTEVVALPSLW